MNVLNQDKLYTMLDIETPADFEYFENLAALMECEEEIEEDVLFGLIEQVDKRTLAELIHNYFEEITDFLPDDAVELFTLLEHVKFSLMGMCGNSGEENVLVNLVDELSRFRKWYSIESRVYCTSFSGEEDGTVPLRDALVLARAEKLIGDNYEYDFTQCLDYPIEEYIMSFGDLAMAAAQEAELAGLEDESTDFDRL